MSKLKYRIQFYSDWHCGSGLAAGADLDALVIKDKDNLPFVPGKTIKGLLREAVEIVNQFSDKNSKISDNVFKSAFGVESDKELGKKGGLFFKNAVLSEEEHKAIVDNKASQYMYRSIASTAIYEDGIADEHSLRKIYDFNTAASNATKIADEHSLRKMEVVVPCSLEGEILYIEDDAIFEILKKALSYVKRLGQNRNRGLGRCKFEFVAKED